MGYWKNEFDKIAIKAIANFSAHYGTECSKTGIRIGLSEDGSLCFYTQIGMEVKEQVKFHKILHGPKAKLDLTGKSLYIPPIIGKVLQRMAERYRVNPLEAKLIVRQEGQNVWVFLTREDAIIKLLGDDELFDDEQIAADQLQEAFI